MTKKKNKSSIGHQLKAKSEKIESKMSRSESKGMEKLIPIINRLLDACTQTGLSLQLDLPQIAVVGSQSAGKSSVLENIVGRDFLPRGFGIVTRRPLILQLTNDKDKEYGKFLHCQDKIFEDFEDIRSEIQAETDRITGTNKGISDEPINLQIFSSRVLDLTLVDLPGITKVPIGDQPDNIEEQTKEMILKYITKKNCLILAVTPANTDLANSDALKLAREVDPEGTRTIGVITKLDLMDPGTDAREILENRVFPLQRGYIGVVNRSQKDIDIKKDIQTALEAEMDFFVKHYSDMADRLGTQHLQTVLNRELIEHIQSSMPSVQDELKKKITLFEGQIGKFKGLDTKDPNEMGHMLLSITQQLATDFKNEIGSFGQESILTDKLSSGAKINEIFHKQLETEIGKIGLTKEETMRALNMAIKNIHGFRDGLYQPQLAFELYTEKQILELKTPINLIFNSVTEELMTAVRTCTQNIIFPNLRDRLKKDIIKYINSITDSARQSVLKLIDMEMAYMNTYNLDFKEKKNDLIESPPTVLNNAYVLHEGARDIYSKLTLYMENVKKNMKDMVPKAITLDLIKKLMKYVTHDIIYTTTKIPSDEFPKLLELDGMDEAKFIAAKKMRVACQDALEDIYDLYEQTNAIGGKGFNANN